MQRTIDHHHHHNQHNNAQPPLPGAVLEGHPKRFHHMRFIKEIDHHRFGHHLRSFLVDRRFFDAKDAVQQGEELHRGGYREYAVETDLSLQNEINENQMEIW